MRRDRAQAIVIGAGIGGLTTALCLHRAGIDAVVYESVSRIRPLGVGINLLPHSVRILTDLGLAGRLDAAAIRTAELAYYNKFGQRIWSEPRGIDAGYRWPQFSVHRGLLQMLLYETVLERLGPDAIRTGHALERVATEGDRALAWFVVPADVASSQGLPRPFLTRAGTQRRSRTDAGSPLARGRQATVEAEADFVVAADGIHSTARRQWYPDEGPPKFAGQLLWRATTVAPKFLTGRTMIMAGHQGQKFVCYPIAHNEDGTCVINWIAERRIGGAEPPRQSDWNREIDRQSFAPLFANWKFDWLDIPALIEGADRVYEFPMVDRDPLPQWTFGRVTLLGDAAHPMYPIGSNGASQAILDADALAASLQSEAGAGQGIPAALARYEAERRPATAKIVESNRQMGPERVMQIVEERAPEGFTDLHAVISREELESIAAAYKRVAGFDRDALNQRAAAV